MQDCVSPTGGLPPVILMIDSANECERISISSWFEASRFSVLDAVDIFSAMEEMSDFTLRDCPDVVLVNVDSYGSDFDALRDVIAAEMGTGTSVMMLSKDGSGRSDCFAGDLQAIAGRLDFLIPEASSTYH